MNALLIESMQYGTRVLKASKHSPLAHSMSEIMGRKVFTANDIKRWQDIGFTFTIARLPE